MYVIPTYKNVMIGVENSEEGQIVDYDQMIRIIYLQQLNAQIDIIYLPSQKTTLTSALLGTFWRALGPPEHTSVHNVNFTSLYGFSHNMLTSSIIYCKSWKWLQHHWSLHFGETFAAPSSQSLPVIHKITTLSHIEHYNVKIEQNKERNFPMKFMYWQWICAWKHPNKS